MLLRILLITGLLALSGDLMAKDPGGKTVPFSGVTSGYLLGFDDTRVGECSPPAGKCAWAVTSFAGSGPLTHLGESELYAEHCSYGYPITEAPFCEADGTYGEGTIRIIADNGDVLLGVYGNGISLPMPPFIGFVDQFEFVDGGTGRFTFASGGGEETGSVDFRDFSFTVRMTGVIAYKKK
ncbi:MAG: hypothetical protein HKP02_11170 [Xanthomonadales bacterium]|nr:hypothetical protein [Xanthomonadales bacterium]